MEYKGLRRKNAHLDKADEVVQDPFIGAIESNDMDAAQTMLQNRKSLVTNQFCTRDAFSQAIRNNNMEMLHVLLESNLNTGCALFHAIDQNSVAAVMMICNQLQSSNLAMKTVLNAFAEDKEFPSYTTPLLLASCQNLREIVKKLIEFGAEFPKVDAMISRAGEEHYDRALARLHYYEAISSEAYMLATPDPLESAFKAGKKVRAFEFAQLPSLRKNYKKIKENLDSFACKILMKVDSTEEIQVLLSKSYLKKKTKGLLRKRGGSGTSDENDTTATVTSSHSSILPKRIRDAIRIDYKQFLVSTNCQQYILSHWYSGRTNWEDLSRLSFTLWTLLVLLCWPVLCLLYILIPMDWVKRTMKAPYVRFLLHFTSRTGFVLLLLESTIAAIIAEHEIVDHYKGYRRVVTYVNYAAGPPDYLTMSIYIMIIGMTWRELKEFWLLGPRRYLQDWFNYVDICQLIFYWISIIMDIVAFYTLYDEERSYPNNKTFDVNLMNSTASDVGYQLRNNSNSHLDHMEWHRYNTLFISEATFAIASVLTFLALLHDAIILEFVGPLLVSFVGMIADIGRFILIFIFVWVSFGIGLTQLYRTFVEFEEAVCQGEDCTISPFASLGSTMQVLFWSLFDLMDLSALKSSHPEDNVLTEYVGIILYGVYMLIAVIVMLNALIAMMNTTYTRVEENSEVEWKLYRTKLMAQYMTNSPTLPPPFNLVPTVKTILRMVSFKSCQRVKNKGANGKETQDHEVAKYERLISLASERYIDELDDQQERDQEQAEMKASLVTMKDTIEVLRNDLKTTRTDMAEVLSQLKQCCETLETNNSKGKFRFGKS